MFKIYSSILFFVEFMHINVVIKYKLIIINANN